MEAFHGLRIGVFLSPSIPQSFRVYAENVLRYFPELGIEVLAFSDASLVPQYAHVIWDVRSGGGNPPLEFMLNGTPLVVTVHGFAPITLSGWQYFHSLQGALLGKRWAAKKLRAWRELKERVAYLICASNFVRSEAIGYTGMAPERIAVCHHGVDTSRFFPAGNQVQRRYFLHVSNNEPRKNLSRVVAAFRRFRGNGDIELVVKVPEDQARYYPGLPGVRVISGFLSSEELAELYRHSLGYVFPSLYEGFGMPILEAMASGCPVITSNVSACPEVAGDSALLVDPHDEDAICSAMRTLVDSESLRNRLIVAGQMRAKGFSWHDSAVCHARILAAAAGR